MRINLLIIEIDDLFRQSLLDHLLLKAHRVFVVDMQAGVKRDCQKKHRCDLTRSEWIQTRGPSLLKTLKGIRPFTGVIIMTSYEPLHLSMAGMKLGAFDEILIPFDLGYLSKLIREAYERRRETKKLKNLYPGLVTR